MPDYSISDLELWGNKIEKLAGNMGLDFFEQEFELVSYEDMIAYEVYTGMPSHYPHWSYGKAFERIKTLNRYNLSGLPYEMVINSNPCIAYLMRDNSLLLQILTIAHVYAHNDFFRNNRLFRCGTRPEYTVGMFKNHAERIREYVSDPYIGIQKVEKILNAAHAVRFQTARVFADVKPVKREEAYIPVKTAQDVFPPAPEEDLLKFISQYSRLEEWEKDVLDMVREEALYFVPQIETKIMNEGWASYWHYMLMQELELPQGLQYEFIKRHNEVVRPFEDGLNPYWLGFEMFKHLNDKMGREKMFEVRETERDESFIRRYLDFELCGKLHLLEYEKSGSDYIVSEIADEEGWRKIRETIASSAGMGSIPDIRITEWIRKENVLVLEHTQDKRELELTYTYETLKYLVDLWDGKIILKTCIDGKKKQIICDEQKKVSLTGI